MDEQLSLCPPCGSTVVADNFCSARHLIARMTLLWSGTGHWSKPGCWRPVGPDLTAQNTEMLQQHLLDTQQLWELKTLSKCWRFSRYSQGLHGRGLHLLLVTRLALFINRTPLTYLMNKEPNNIQVNRNEVWCYFPQWHWFSPGLLRGPLPRHSFL